jgi:hypothetical protein
MNREAASQLTLNGNDRKRKFSETLMNGKQVDEALSALEVDESNDAESPLVGQELMAATHQVGQTLTSLLDQIETIVQS